MSEYACCAVAGTCVSFAAAAAGVCCPHTNISVEVSDGLDQRTPLDVSLMGWMQRRVCVPSSVQSTADFLTGPPSHTQTKHVSLPALRIRFCRGLPSLPGFS